MVNGVQSAQGSHSSTATHRGDEGRMDLTDILLIAPVELVPAIVAVMVVTKEVCIEQLIIQERARLRTIALCIT